MKANELDMVFNLTTAKLEKPDRSFISRIFWRKATLDLTDEEHQRLARLYFRNVHTSASPEINRGEFA